jgi:HK97 gp10 family phage protein
MSIVVINNLPDFKRQLAEVKKKTRASLVRASLRAAANFMAKQVRIEAPMLAKATKNRIPGTLKAAIYASRGKAGADRERYFIAVKKKSRSRGGGRTKKGKVYGDAFYWRFLEDGWIPRGPGKKLMGGNRSRALQRRRLIAGGAKRMRIPFFEPAFKQYSGRALEIFNERMERGFEKLSRDIK